MPELCLRATTKPLNAVPNLRESTPKFWRNLMIGWSCAKNCDGRQEAQMGVTTLQNLHLCLRLVGL